VRLPTVDRAAFETGVLPFLRLHAAEPMQDLPRVRLRGGCGGALGLGLGLGLGSGSGSDWAWFGFWVLGRLRFYLRLVGANLFIVVLGPWKRTNLDHQSQSHLIHPANHTSTSTPKPKPNQTSH
jgi:hypothetical protein